MLKETFLAFGLLVFTGSRAQAADSLDTWTKCVSGVPQNLYGAAYGGGRYVCVGQAGALLVSSNGLDWQTAASGVTSTLYGASFGNGCFVAVGTAGVILQSSNSLDWHLQSSPTTNQLNGVNYCGGLFVATGNSGSLLISSNGSDWTAQNTPTTRSLVGCAHGNGLFVVVGRGNSDPGTILTSSNAVDWVDRSAVNLGVGFYAVAFGHGVFTALDARAVAYTSSDGLAWSRHYPANADYVFGITFAQDLFVAVGGPYSGGGQKVATAPDGVQWTMRPVSLTNSAVFRAVTYGNGYFIAAGDKGMIARSGPVATLKLSAMLNGTPTFLLEGENGRVYRLQSSEGLATPQWSDVLTITNLAEDMPVTDPQAGNSSVRFYRTVSP